MALSTVPISTDIALVALAVTVLGALAVVLTHRLSLNKVAAVIEQHRFDQGLVQTVGIEDVAARNPLKKKRTRRGFRPARWIGFTAAAVLVCAVAWAVMTGYAGASTGPQHALPAHANPAGAVILIVCAVAGIFWVGRLIVRGVTSR